MLCSLAWSSVLALLLPVFADVAYEPDFRIGSGWDSDMGFFVIGLILGLLLMGFVVGVVVLIRMMRKRRQAPRPGAPEHSHKED